VQRAARVRRWFVHSHACRGPWRARNPKL
jgi:hypothetical protein